MVTHFGLVQGSKVCPLSRYYILEDDGRLTEAFDCFQKMQDELLENTDAYKKRAQWELGKRSHR